MIYRDADQADASKVSAMLMDLAKAGKRTRPSDETFVREDYIGNPDKVSCMLALDEDGSVLGLQILTIAREGNPYGTPPGYGIIGTHVHPNAARRGVGKALFAKTQIAAQNAGLEKIDATIGDDNDEGLGYYTAMGFETYRTMPNKTCKCYTLSVN